jgi:hypothetical protein
MLCVILWIFREDSDHGDWPTITEKCWHIQSRHAPAAPTIGISLPLATEAVASEYVSQLQKSGVMTLCIDVFKLVHI